MAPWTSPVELKTRPWIRSSCAFQSTIQEKQPDRKALADSGCTRQLLADNSPFGKACLDLSLQTPADMPQSHP
ncbi:hypothetical protein LEMLEM_LOCUS8977 [Lemmus lemmus]